MTTTATSRARLHSSLLAIEKSRSVERQRLIGQGCRTTAIAFACCLVIAPLANAVTLTPPTIGAWNACVATTEARIDRELSSWGRSLRVEEPRGTTLDVDGGVISQWRGSIFLPGVQLDDLLSRLQHPREQGPHQEDVLAVRVLKREKDSLDLFIRMTRTKIVTVTYDTEHHVEYRRHGSLRASSRSVATRITELDDEGRGKIPGEDRGFLWRMNAYWRYEQVRGGVIVDLESLTLSRGIPLGVGTVVRPLINRVARESMARTLDNIRRTYSS
jgi:hypothetical protein